MSVSSIALPRWHGQHLRMAQAIWLSVAALAALIGLAALPAYVLQLGQLTPADRLFLTRIAHVAELTREIEFAFDLLAMLISLVISLTAFGLGVLIFRQRGEEHIAWYVSLYLLAFSVVMTGPFEVLSSALGGDAVLVGFLAQALVFILGNTWLFFVFPDGRFVPRWTRPLAFVLVPWSVGSLFLVGQFLGFDTGRINPLLATIFFVWVLLPALTSVAAQIYRYRYVSSAAQQQQTKWVVFGFAIWVLMGVAVAPIYIFLLRTADAPPDTLTIVLVMAIRLSRWLGVSLLPIALGIALLRHRLWDIDLILRRTLTYSLLTVALGAVYYGLVILSGTIRPFIFRQVIGQPLPEIGTVFSTPLTAVLFIPLRRRIQNAIDRHFFRHKYDAAQTLASFGATVRDEVDLNALSSKLLRVVDETMQPEHLSLWLRPPTEHKHDRS